MTLTWAKGMRLHLSAALLLAMACGGAVAEQEDLPGRGASAEQEPVANLPSSNVSSEREAGSVSNGSCEASWESIGLRGLVQRRQWTAPDLTTDCDAGVQILTTDSEQGGFPIRLTFVFQRNELLEATYTVSVPGFEYESDFDVNSIRFDDLATGRRRIEFDGRIVVPEGDAIAAQGVGNACLLPSNC